MTNSLILQYLKVKKKHNNFKIGDTVRVKESSTTGIIVGILKHMEIIIVEITCSVTHPIGNFRYLRKTDLIKL